ncbi:MAG: Uma2 family endonuclease [Pleurocapsa sp. MO_226.B13]|nr:Uma2 family endonuclease [Pleurocapsa sp. MO_226.B13]
MSAINISAFTEKISDRDLEKLCADNPETRFETTPEGRLIVMPPTGSESGKRNGDLFGQIWYWNCQTKLGVVFDSSTGFKLSNGAIRSPDLSWVEKVKWESLNKQQQRKFAPIDPDFVIELMSPTDDLTELQAKMAEYISCGVKLGWLINPDEKQVEIYRNGQDKEFLDNPQSLSGENILPNLTVDLAEIFE